jgi:replicative DNA helicase
VRAHGIKIVFVDYLTCIKAADSSLTSNHLRVDSVSKGLLAIAKELKIPIVCLAQLNRNVTTRVDKSPTLADFREGGEEDADVCLLLHRPRYYDDQSTDDTTHLIIAKNRLLGNLCRIKYKIDSHSPSVYRELSDLDVMMAAAVAAPKTENSGYYYDR